MFTYVSTFQIAESESVNVANLVEIFHYYSLNCRDYFVYCRKRVYRGCI